MLAGYRIGLGAPSSCPFLPNTCEEKQRALIRQCEPYRRLTLGCRVRFVIVFAKRCCRHQASTFRLEHRLPETALGISDVCYRLAAEYRGAGNTPPHFD